MKRIHYKRQAKRPYCVPNRLMPPSLVWKLTENKSDVTCARCIKRMREEGLFTKTYAVTIYVEVTDTQALKKAAECRAVADGVTLKDWRKSRGGPQDDLRMLLDPGVSPDGTSIYDSTCE